MKVFAMLLLFTVPASAIAAQPADGKKSNKQERKICKSEEQAGSRVSKSRTCRTAAEWNELTGVADLPMDHSYKAQRGNGEGLGKGPN